MTTNTDPFISPQDLIDIMGVGGTADPGLLMATDAACEIIRNQSYQLFNPVVTDVVALDGSGTDALLLPELPVTAAGTVTVNGGTITDYCLASDGMLLRGTAGADPRSVWPAGRQNVRVTYDHGYDASNIPRDVRMVAVMLAHRIVSQGPAIEEATGPTSIKYAGPALDLTAGEQRILQRYRPIA